jgi:hypothetical protein
LATVTNACAIERSAHGVISHTGEILYSTATNQYNRVFLQVVTLATDITGHFMPIREPYASDLTQRGIWLFRSGCVHTSTHASPLRTRFQRRNGGVHTFRTPRLPDQLIDSCHFVCLFAPGPQPGIRCIWGYQKLSFNFPEKKRAAPPGDPHFVWNRASGDSPQPALSRTILFTSARCVNSSLTLKTGPTPRLQPGHLIESR